jgi:hypothetical protein
LERVYSMEYTNFLKGQDFFNILIHLTIL